MSEKNCTRDLEIPDGRNKKSIPNTHSKIKSDTEDGSVFLLIHRCIFVYPPVGAEKNCVCKCHTRQLHFIIQKAKNITHGRQASSCFDVRRRAGEVISRWKSNFWQTVPAGFSAQRDFDWLELRVPSKEPPGSLAERKMGKGLSGNERGQYRRVRWVRVFFPCLIHVTAASHTLITNCQRSRNVAWPEIGENTDLHHSLSPPWMI
jgi:hypothetical protein